MRNKILFLLIAFSLFQCTKQPTNAVEGQQSSDPGFESDLELMKVEDGIHIPNNYRTYWKAAEFRSDRTGVENVVELGPFDVGGRTRAIVIDHSNRNHVLAGAISGGLWESFDGGTTWIPRETYSDNLSITYMDQSDIDPNIIFYTSGEVSGNSAGVSGVGVFRSLDNGQTFELLPASNTNDFFSSWRVHCSRINPNILYIATQTGLFKSNDLGDSFEQVYFGHVSDIELTAADEVYIGVDGDGVYFSPNGELNSFSKIGPNQLPDELARIELALCPQDENYIYMSYEGAIDFDGIEGIYKSTDAGRTWSLMPDLNDVIRTDFAWYTNTLMVSDKDCDLLFAGSIEAGYFNPNERNWNFMPSGHADQHIFLNGIHDNTLLVGNDGGIYEVPLDAETGLPLFENPISKNDGYAVTQFYTGALHPLRDQHMGGTQDNGTWLYDIDSSGYYKLFGGDGAFCYFDTLKERLIFSFQRGNFFSLQPIPNSFPFTEDIFTAIPSSSPYFINPLYASNYDTETFFVPVRNQIFISRDFGQTTDTLVSEVEFPYTVVDKFRNDQHTLFYAGARGLLNRINDLENHNYIDPGFDMTKNMPEELRTGFIRDITFDPQYDSVLYVCFSTRSQASRIWKVTDIYSQSPEWIDVGRSLPQFLPVNDIAFLKEPPYTFVAGTDYGVYTKRDTTWQRVNEIPPVVIFSIQSKRRSMYAFSHGRGIFRLDLETSTNHINENNIAKFMVYPNPTSPFQNIQWEADRSIDEVLVFNPKGQPEAHFKGENLNTITTPYQAGTYILIFKSNSNIVARRKLVIQ